MGDIINKQLKYVIMSPRFKTTTITLKQQRLQDKVDMTKLRLCDLILLKQTKIS